MLNPAPTAQPPPKKNPTTPVKPPPTSLGQPAPSPPPWLPRSTSAVGLPVSASSTRHLQHADLASMRIPPVAPPCGSRLASSTARGDPCLPIHRSQPRPRALLLPPACTTAPRWQCSSVLFFMYSSVCYFLQFCSLYIGQPVSVRCTW